MRNILVDSTFKPGRAIAPEIDGIDLGVFWEEARVLANECFMDLENNNVGKLVYVTGAKKVLVPNSFFKGVGRGPLGIFASVSAIPKHEAERQQINSRYIGMVFHTQSNSDLPFTPTGLYLLTNNDSVDFASTAVFVVGKTQNMLLFRGSDAPQWTEEEANQKRKLWEFQLGERVKQFIKPEMSHDEVFDMVIKAQWALMKQICAKYDLSFFAGPTDSPVVTKQFSQI